jgi:hypothetical protein
MKRTIVWIDDSDKDSAKARVRLKKYLADAGLKFTLFEAIEVMESEN